MQVCMLSNKTCSLLPHPSIENATVLISNCSFIIKITAIAQILMLLGSLLIIHSTCGISNFQSWKYDRTFFSPLIPFQSLSLFFMFKSLFSSSFSLILSLTTSLFSFKVYLYLSLFLFFFCARVSASIICPRSFVQFSWYTFSTKFYQTSWTFDIYIYGCINFSFDIAIYLYMCVFFSLSYHLFALYKQRSCFYNSLCR